MVMLRKEVTEGKFLLSHKLENERKVSNLLYKFTPIPHFCQISIFMSTYFLILFLIFLSSSSSVGLLLFYMNPVSEPAIAFSLMWLGLFLASSSLLTFVIFFTKKIYYRGDVHIRTMNASLRQAILITIGGMLMLALRAFHIYEPRLIMTVWMVIACLEVMIQSIE